MTLREHTKKEEVRGLTIKQPYAQLMLHGKVEVRSWSTPYRGWVLLAAAKEGYKSRDVEILSGKYKQYIDNIMAGRHVYKGKALFIGRLVDCRLLESKDYARTYIEETKEPMYGHFFEDVVRVFPADITGRLGYYKVSDDLLDKIVLL